MHISVDKSDKYKTLKAIEVGNFNQFGKTNINSMLRRRNYFGKSSEIIYAYQCPDLQVLNCIKYSERNYFSNNVDFRREKYLVFLLTNQLFDLDMYYY